ncbi:uncharacterized mitochondrial protein AtMg00820-like [Gossypium arboreum]|uniref:uncharacterized mitochondrial protein AtMg00820-like n=1 Tax=Gossypium arboreum TaxID=29729 RepID=UPI0008190A71|nr:uncharacterized mitochondrial protein AtMg00820-like [Gossypium arboreum]
MEPQFFKESVKNAGWRSSMQMEVRALKANGTWMIKSFPPRNKTLGSKWVYKIKYNSDGTIERLKAHLVVLNNHQIEGIDYNETFVLVENMVTIRTLLAIVASKIRCFIKWMFIMPFCAVVLMRRATEEDDA